VSHEKNLFLIVDDEPEICWVFEHILKKNGFACRKALSAREAMTLADQYTFCLAFFDAKLPDLDGIELARQIRRTHPRLPIVIVSAYFYRDDITIEEAIQSGLVAGFISKPFIHDEIKRVIDLYASH